MSAENTFNELFSGKPKIEATAEMRQAATSLFQIYCSYVEAGFTPAQAMQFIVAILMKS